MSEGKERLTPVGECWCGCHAEIQDQSFFKQGHDMRVKWLIQMIYGGDAEFLSAYGYGSRSPYHNLDDDYNAFLQGENPINRLNDAR
jgi:hypothetical protein